MAKAYAVTEGCYSDYHVCGITLDKEAAEAFVERYPDCRIEDYDTDDIDIIKRGCYLYEVILDNNGDLISTYKNGSCYLVEYRNRVFPIRKASGRSVRWYKAYVGAVDDDHAVKIAADLIAQYRYGKGQ